MKNARKSVLKPKMANQGEVIKFRIDLLRKKGWAESMKELGVKDFPSYARHAIDRSIALDLRSKDKKWQKFLSRTQDIAKEVLGYGLADNLEHLENLTKIEKILFKRGQELAKKRGIKNLPDLPEVKEPVVYRCEDVKLLSTDEATHKMILKKVRKNDEKGAWVSDKFRHSPKGWKFSKPSSAKEAVEIRRGVAEMKSGKVRTISSKKLIKHLKIS